MVRKMLRHALCSSDRSVPSVRRAFPATGCRRLQQDLDRLGIVERGEEHRSKVSAQLFQAAPKRLIFSVALFDSVLYKCWPCPPYETSGSSWCL